MLAYRCDGRVLFVEFDPKPILFLATKKLAVVLEEHHTNNSLDGTRNGSSRLRQRLHTSAKPLQVHVVALRENRNSKPGHKEPLVKSVFD